MPEKQMQYPGATADLLLILQEMGANEDTSEREQRSPFDIKTRVESPRYFGTVKVRSMGPGTPHVKQVSAEFWAKEKHPIHKIHIACTWTSEDQHNLSVSFFTPKREEIIINANHPGEAIHRVYRQEKSVTVAQLSHHHVRRVTNRILDAAGHERTSPWNQLCNEINGSL